MNAKQVSKTALGGLCALVLASSALAGEGAVRILERPRLPAFGSLQQAIDVALDGETLLVGEGDYSAIRIDGRKLALLAAPGATPVVTGTSRVENVGLQRSVVLAGIEFRGESFPGVAFTPGSPALALESNAGGVWLLNCTLNGGDGAVGSSPSQLGAGAAALEVRSSGRVALARCMLVGGDGGNHPSPNPEDGLGGRGGAGIDAQNSTLALYSTTALGGAGGRAGTRGGDGGDGLSLVASGVYLGACTARGGKGGATLDFLVDDGANGGHGVEGDAASQTRIVDSLLQGGLAGSCPVCSIDGVDGSPTAGTGLVVPYAGSARVFTAERITGDRELWNVSVSGVPGDRVFLVDNDRPTLTAAQPVLGVTLVPPPPGALAQLGVIPASGVLSVQARIPGLLASASTRQRFVQGLVLDSAGQSWPSTPLLRVELSRFGGADCDANGRNDALEVVRGLVPDVDGDLAPDACALDCNNNAQSDVTDVLSGLSADVDNDLVPDVCETATTIYVDVNAPAGGDGSVHAPFRALRPAIAAVLPGAVVLVRDGVYSSSADREVDTRGKSFTLRSSGGAAACIVDPGGAGRALRAFGGGDVVVEGVTFRNGAALALPNEPLIFRSGGAIYSDSGQLFVRDCVFENNTSLSGGALALRSGRLERCSFVGNSVPVGSSGGAVDCFGPLAPAALLAVIDTEFRGNQAGTSGGALRVAATANVLDGCRFVENTAQSGGAVMFLGASNAALELNAFNCVFAGNVATNGGALYFSSTSLPQSTLRAQNSTFVGNVAAAQGGGVYFIGRGFFVLENNIQRGNSSGSGAVNRAAPAFGPIELHVNRNCVQGGAAAFQGGLQFYNADNFDLDPLFLAPAGLDGNPATFADNDYRLPPLSPCVDAGDASLLWADLADRDNDGYLLEALPRDLAGAPRRIDDPLTPDSGPAVAPALDLGAFERVP
ncbi:MAG: hypothetical protein JNN27_08730 [Planctomycetes bacterium]|nr:hypothetical protein [Planctomycetota bacterium]